MYLYTYVASYLYTLCIWSLQIAVLLKTMMKSLLWLLLIDLARVSIQQCTMEVFEDSIALDILQATEATESNQHFVINETIYNCLSTSRTIGILGSMSVSILYTRSDTPNRLRDVRYDMLCVGKVWMRAGQMSTAFSNNNTRTNCSSCLSDANDHHCACKWCTYITYAYSQVNMDACMVATTWISGCWSVFTRLLCMHSHVWLVTQRTIYNLTKVKLTSFLVELWFQMYL